MSSNLIIIAYEPDGLGGVVLQCRREGMHERVPNFPVRFGAWGIFRGASSALGPLSESDRKFLRDKAIAYTSGKAL